MVKYTDEEWEHIGHEWRKAAGMDDAVRIDAPAFVRWLKHDGYIKDYVCVPDEDLPNAEGKYEPDEDRVYYRNSTWRGALKGYPHDVWTLVHEGCHPILKHKATRLRSSVQKADRFSSRHADRDEVNANRLAASILAPLNKVDFKPGMTADYLREQFGLSRQAAERRLREFDRMYRQKHGIKRELPPGIVDFLSAQRRKGYPVTSLPDTSISPINTTKRYEGEPCPCCGEFKLVRLGLFMKCDGCQAKTGED
jgi:hypothetical protein